MGIGISLSGLASAVANAGGIGIISGVQIGFREPDFEKDPVSANIRAIGKELRRARELAPNGIIGMNFMSIDSHYAEYVTEAVKQGAGLDYFRRRLAADPAGIDRRQSDAHCADCLLCARVSVDFDQVAAETQPFSGTPLS